MNVTEAFELVARKILEKNGKWLATEPPKGSKKKIKGGLLVRFF